MLKRIAIAASTLSLLSLWGCTTPQPSAKAEGSPQVIVLTQTGCQFLETEKVDHQYKPKSAADCDRINAESLTARQPDFKPLELAAGDYIFRVTNQNVPYELGFYLRGNGVQNALLPKVSGGGLTQGVTQEYKVTLTPGSYVYSCPLNPTPDYSLIVK